MYGEVYFSLTAVTPGAENYFGIDDNGNLFVIRDLVNSGVDSYQVSLFMDSKVLVKAKSLLLWLSILNIFMYIFQAKRKENLSMNLRIFLCTV